MDLKNVLVVIIKKNNLIVENNKIGKNNLIVENAKQKLDLDVLFVNNASENTRTDKKEEMRERNELL